MLRGCVCCYVMKNALLQSLQLLRGGIWACMRCHCLCLCCFWDGDYVSQLPYVRHNVLVKSSLKHAREECESKRAYVFRCLMFSLSGPCELVFYFVLLRLGPELW